MTVAKHVRTLNRCRSRNTEHVIAVGLHTSASLSTLLAPATSINRGCQSLEATNELARSDCGAWLLRDVNDYLLEIVAVMVWGVVIGIVIGVAVSVIARDE